MDYSNFENVSLYIRLGLLILAVAIVAFILWRRSRATKITDDRDLVMDKPVEASLRVIESSDKTIIDKVCHILRYPVKIGRDLDNDMMLPDDTVSRYHVVLEKVGKRVTLREVGTKWSDRKKRPSFGTKLIREEGVQTLEDRPIEILFGDKIQLGNTLLIRYENPAFSGPKAFTFDKKKNRG